MQVLLILLILLILVLIALIWRFNPRTKRAINKEEAVPLSALETCEPKPPPSKNADEELADALQALRHAIRKKAKEDGASLRNEINNAEQRLKAAEELAKTLGVSTSIVAIADEMRHWSAWSKNEKFDFSKYLVDGLCYVDGKEFRTEKGDKTTINEFIFDHRKYGNYHLDIVGQNGRVKRTGRRRGDRSIGGVAFG